MGHNIDLLIIIIFYINIWMANKYLQSFAFRE